MLLHIENLTPVGHGAGMTDTSEADIEATTFTQRAQAAQAVYARKGHKRTCLQDS